MRPSLVPPTQPPRSGNVSPTNVGFYSVVITNANGQRVTSLAASLEIGTDTSAHSYDKLEDLLDYAAGLSGPIRIPPPGGTASAFPSVSVGTLGSQIINNFNSTTEQGEPVHSSVIGGSSRWYLLTATTNATMEIDTLGSDIATVLAVYTGGSIFLAAVDCDQRERRAGRCAQSGDVPGHEWNAVSGGGGRGERRAGQHLCELADGGRAQSGWGAKNVRDP